MTLAATSALRAPLDRPSLLRGRRRLVWGGATLFIALFIIGALWLSAHGQQRARGESVALLESHVRGVEAALNRNLLAVDLLLAGSVDWVALARRVDNGIDAATLARLLRAASSQTLLVRDLVVFDQQGRLVAAAQAHTERQPPPLPPGFAERVLAQAVPAMAISAPVLSPVTNEQVLFLARLLRTPAGERWLAVAEVQLPLLARLFERSGGGAGLAVTLERDDGELLASLPLLDTRLGQRLAPPLTAAAADGLARDAACRLAGVPALQALRPTLYPGVLLSVGLPLETVYADWAVERRVVGWTTALMVTLMLLAAAIVDWQWRRLLAARAELAGLNARLEQQVAERTAALAEREALLRVVTENVPVAISYRSADGRVLFANARFARAVGHADAAAVIGQQLEDVFPPQVRQIHIEHSRRATAGESVRYEAPRAGDASRTVEVLLEPDRDAQGQVRGVFAASLDITERKLASAALARSNAELRRFAEVSAHHLMEPARRLATYSQRVRNGLARWPDALADEGLSAAVSTLEVDARRLVALVRDIQRYLSAGEPRGAVDRVDSGEVFDSVRQALQGPLREQGVQLLVGALPPVWMDRARLAEVFALLLDNALGHGRPAQWGVAQVVRIEGRRLATDARCRFELADNGPGIPAQYHERVFGLFERLGSAPAPTGTGIGLAIVRRIVESVGGRIWIESPAGGGTLVLFELPAPADTA